MEKNLTNKTPIGINKILKGIKNLSQNTFDLKVEKFKLPKRENTEEGIQKESFSQASGYITDYEVLWPVCVLLV